MKIKNYFNKESELSIKAIDNELERLHTQHKHAEDYEKDVIWERIIKTQDLLELIARRYNGLEY